MKSLSKILKEICLIYIVAGHIVFGILYLVFNSYMSTSYFNVFMSSVRSSYVTYIFIMIWLCYFTYLTYLASSENKKTELMEGCEYYQIARLKDEYEQKMLYIQKLKKQNKKLRKQVKKVCSKQRN